MLFNSLEFAIFFPAVCALYFTLPARWRTPLLLGSSCAFYMAFVPSYIAILGTTILIDYFAGLGLAVVSPGRRRLLLLASIVATCVVLIIFKYFNFLLETFTGAAHLWGWDVQAPALRIILPIGLSFHTFQSLSYVIEVYRGHQEPERNFVRYATYVMFFPQLVAGPIERPQNLLHQFRETHDFDYARITSGLRRMAWGFFKKLVVADRLAIYVNDVYGGPQSHNGLQLAVATVFFAYQIYCDFSGYSDIAIGTARVLGFRLMENFDTPYFSRSVGEFWRRWHISLSTWFRDYVYIPMGGSRVATGRRSLNLLVTFGISGLWHGANWTYVVWGTLNGLYLVAGMLTAPLRSSLLAGIGMGEASVLRNCSKVVVTFTLTCAAWVLFRAESLSEAGYIYSHLFSNWDFSAFSTEHFSLRQLPAAAAGLTLLLLIETVRPRIGITTMLGRAPALIRWPAYAGFAFVVLLLGVYRSNQFIYFQF